MPFHQRGVRHFVIPLLMLMLTGCGEERAERPGKPEPRINRTVQDLGKPNCRKLSVKVKVKESISSYSWDSSTSKWVETKGAVMPSSGERTRPATASDCLRTIHKVPGKAALPDLTLKDLARCGDGDKKATGGDCFMIVNPAPFYEDFPELEGRKLLKFPIITLNVGDGPSEIIADRSAYEADDWKAYQTFYTAKGKRLGSTYAPEIEFYFAGDGHDHWHVRDFDQYEILDARGKIVRRAEKHGYCMQDNTSFGEMLGQPGVPPEPGVYLDTTSCGKGLPRALTFIHGLSKGWGDTYPTDLPDQAVDITGLPNGKYIVKVHADAYDYVKESDEDNNDASIQITIKGDKVTVHPSTAVGGVQ